MILRSLRPTKSTALYSIRTLEAYFRHDKKFTAGFPLEIHESDAAIITDEVSQESQRLASPTQSGLVTLRRVDFIPAIAHSSEH